MNPISKIVWKFSAQARQKRAQMFRSYFSIDGTTKILDLGSENGTNIFNVLQNTSYNPNNVYIADINENAVEEGKRNYGFNPVLIDESGKLAFEDKFFDIVYCSSVIEHVTVVKSDVWTWKDGKEFREESFKHQKLFADEIIRLGKKYFVQTPSKNFPVESHTWLPIVGYLPRKQFLPVLKLSNRFWVKQAEPDFNLLDANDMKRLFPDAKIVSEKKYGLTKSIMAIKND
ncbi:MAG TPA: class I SAM-dependent methyltransferase [Pyrinomonadaceae bacterium]|nr:class I SAM-dependent methyltransferase [Pyrinomonadaceae bacterium]